MDFYDRLAPFYPIIYGDWETAFSAKHNCEATAQQSAQLSTIVRSQWGTQIQTMLDVSCGIGTQALGLAEGYQVTASDLSRQAIDRAQREAQTRSLDIDFSVCDMRAVYGHHQYLLNDAEILTALGQMYACTRPGGRANLLRGRKSISAVLFLPSSDHEPD